MKVMDSQTIHQKSSSEPSQQNTHSIRALITFHIKIFSASRRDKPCNYLTGLVIPWVMLKSVASLVLFQEITLFQSSSGEYEKTPQEALDITLKSP